MKKYSALILALLISLSAISGKMPATKKASAILYVYNQFATLSITQVSLTYTNPSHSPMTVNIPTAIGPGGSSGFSFGTVNENVTVTLTLSASAVGSIYVTRPGNNSFPALACGYIMGSPSIYFYFNATTHLTVTGDDVDCG